MNKIGSSGFVVQREEVPLFKAFAERGSVLCDFISVTRNSTQFSSQFSKMAPMSIVPILQVVPGAIGTVIGLKGMYDTGYAFLFESETTIDKVRSFMGFTVMSAFTLLCSSLFVVGVTSSVAAGVVLGTVAVPFFYGSLLATGCIKAMVHSYFLHNFTKEFEGRHTSQEKSERLHILLQEEGYREWIYFNTDGKDPLLHQMIENIARDPSFFDQHPFLVSQVVDEIVLSAKKRRFEQMVFAIIGALGVATMAMGPMSYVVFAVSAIIWLAIDSYDVNRWVTDSLYGESLLKSYAVGAVPSGLIGDVFSLTSLQSRYPGS